MLTFFGNLTEAENVMNIRNNGYAFMCVCLYVFIFWLLTLGKNNPHWREIVVVGYMGNGVSILYILLYM